MFVDCHDIGKIEFRNWEKICETSFFEFLGIFLAQKNGGPNCVIFSKMNEEYISSTQQGVVQKLRRKMERVGCHEMPIIVLLQGNKWSKRAKLCPCSN